MNKDNENWKKGPPFTSKNKAYLALNVSSMITGGLALILGSVFSCSLIHTAYQNKTLDYRKWAKINEQRTQEQISQRNSYEQRVLNKAYNFFDLNQDGIISRKEFEEGVKKGPKDCCYKADYIDRLNWDLKLDEKHVELVRE